MSAPVIVWFRRDLRLCDNPALFEAARSGKPVIALYIYETSAKPALGAASKWWLHHSLTRLSEDLAGIGLKLHFRLGEAAQILAQLIKETGADRVIWNRRYSASGIECDTALKDLLAEQNVTAESFKANLLNEPWEIKNKSGGYYKVFTPYWRAVQQHGNPAPALPAPRSTETFSGDLSSVELQALNLLPKRPDWGAKMTPYWSPGEAGAKTALNEFLDGPSQNYAADRDRPDRRGTSQLSPHLAFGEISPRQIWHAAHDHSGQHAKFMSEIGWREFSYALLFHNPKLAFKNFRPEFDKFEWQEKTDHLRRWQTGQTGYPFVDAGMRQLWETGWQHNRVRMVTASFLIKHLMIDWREGEAWFWDTLVDADPASNAASWQWVTGSGADAAPYFRIFNPFGQGEKFDPNGDYVRKWVPEIAGLPDRYIQTPWTAPKDILSQAGIALGDTYPEPIIEHKFARERALKAYQHMRNSNP